MEELKIEEAFAKLEELLAKMESPEITLEESFACYEEGMKLVKHCSDTIDRVENQVQVIAADGSLTELRSFGGRPEAEAD